jgi:hypothetical protein
VPCIACTRHLRLRRCAATPCDHSRPEPLPLQEAFEAAIDVARRRTVEEVTRWGQGGASAVAGTPPGDTSGQSLAGADDTLAGSDVGTPPRAGSDRKQRGACRAGGDDADGMHTPRGATARGSGVSAPTPGSASRSSAGAGAGAQVEARILAKVVAVVSPAPAAAGRLLARRAVTTRPDAPALGLGEAAAMAGGEEQQAQQQQQADVSQQQQQQQHGGGSAGAPAAVRKSMGIAGSRAAVVGSGAPTSGRRGNVFRS